MIHSYLNSHTGICIWIPLSLYIYIHIHMNSCIHIHMNECIHIYICMNWCMSSWYMTSYYESWIDGSDFVKMNFLYELNTEDWGDFNILMIEFFCPILEHFCTLFVRIAQMGLILPRWALILARIPPPPLFFTQPSQTTFGDTKPPQTHPKTLLFLAWTWKWAKWTTIWANWTPSGQNVWKVGKTFLEVGKKKSFIIF